MSAIDGDPRATPPSPATGPAPPDSGAVPRLVPRIRQIGSIPTRQAVPERRRRSRRSTGRLSVDWPQCRAHGLCHELLPELIGRDEWGYPVIAGEPVPAALVDDARRAVAACPTLALRIVASR